MSAIRSKAFWLFAAVAIYGAMWLLTYFIGAPQVRHATLRRMGIDRTWRELPRPKGDGGQPPYIPGGPTYFCAVSCYAPFFLTVRYGVTLSGEGGIGGSAVHLWFVIPSRPIPYYDWAV